MAKQELEDRVLETSTTTGTGALTLAGAVNGYVTFGSKVSNGDEVRFYIEAVDASGVPTGDFEVSEGIWSTGGTLTRVRVFSSSNAGSLVNFSAGTKRVGLTVPARSYIVNSLGNQLARWSLNHMG